MMRPTVNLRFERRQDAFDLHTYRVLQQQWMDDDPPDEGGIKYVWRDVPMVDAPQATDVVGTSGAPGASSRAPDSAGSRPDGGE